MALSRPALAVLVAIIAGAAFAEESPMPPEIAGKLHELGRVIDPPKTVLLYVFMPEAPSSGRPVLMFVHGGAFIGGNKRMPGTPFYDNVMLWAVKNGFVGVNITYRLAPPFPWPAGAEDIASAIQWVSN